MIIAKHVASVPQGAKNALVALVTDVVIEVRIAAVQGTGVAVATPSTADLIAAAHVASHVVGIGAG